jgi:ribose transport system ATP-binding protein/rhamnose transport system ATP-binding protein
MTTTNAAHLSARAISKRYGAVLALDEVNLELRSGEVMALLGENGAGKSTIVKLLSGLIHPDSGTITIDGSQVEITSPAASQRAGIAVVQQEYSTVGAMSIAENLILGSSTSRAWWGRRYLHDQAAALLERVGLGHLDPDTYAEELTVAEMQLLEIARVLARNASIIIFDEPTAALSDAEIIRVLNVVRRLRDEGKAIVYVTHRLGEVFQIADRVTIFRNGRSEDARDVAGLDVDTIISLMLGRNLGELYPPRSQVDIPGGLQVQELLVSGLRGPLNFEARRGRILGFTGQLGAGASSALQALSGTLPVLHGSIHIDGIAVNTRSRQAGIRAGIAYCSPDRKRDGIFPGVAIDRNLSSPWLGQIARLGIVSVRREREACRRSARQMALDVGRLRASVETLSGGNQQKVAVGRWLGIQPQVLLIDEPTRGVDVGARAEIYRQLRELCNAGLTVVIASSDTNEIFGLCDDIATFHRGEMTASAPAAEWTEESLVRAVMHQEMVA